MTRPRIMTTPFHGRTAGHNSENAWLTSGRYSIAARYSSVAEEALAARISVVMADITPVQRLTIHGPGAARLLSASCATDVNTMTAGAACAVVWRADGGGVRGTGVIVRVGPERFFLEAVDTDIAWFARASARFGAQVEQDEAPRGLLYLAGPLANEMLVSSGLDAVALLEPCRQLVFEWHGLLIVASRWGMLGGVQIECAAIDAVSVFDRLIEAGRPYALRLVGQEALNLLALESGPLVTGLDFTQARSDDASEPSAAMLGLATGNAARVTRGIAWDGDQTENGAVLFGPDPTATLAVGEITRSAYSPALGSMIGYCLVDAEMSAPGTELVLRRLARSGTAYVSARLIALPFLA